jgi:hypothetical protein
MQRAVARSHEDHAGVYSAPCFLNSTPFARSYRRFEQIPRSRATSLPTRAGWELNYRAALRKAGLQEATQWLAGSFVEGKELPNDVDVVTWFDLDPTTEASVANANRDLFRSSRTKVLFLVDGYAINMRRWPPAMVRDQGTYWYGLFSHTRQASLWKGMAQVELAEPDVDARQMLSQLAQAFGVKS